MWLVGKPTDICAGHVLRCTSLMVESSCLYPSLRRLGKWVCLNIDLTPRSSSHMGCGLVCFCMGQWTGFLKNFLQVNRCI